MYTKLLKHESKANLRYLVPLYIIFLFTTISIIGISHIPFINEKLPFITNLFFLVYILSLFLLAAATICLVVYRFYKNLMTGEGYLMFTLPVSTHELILSKLATAILSIIITTLLIIFSIFLVDNTASHLFISDASMESLSLSYYADYLGKGNIIYIIILLICVVAIQTLYYYLCISIGQMFSQNKILGSLIAYIILGTALQIISLIAIAILAIFIKNPYNILPYLHILLPIMILVALIAIVVLYLCIHYILKKKLNLE